LLRAALRLICAPYGLQREPRRAVTGAPPDGPLEQTYTLNGSDPDAGGSGRLSTPPWRSAYLHVFSSCMSSWPVWWAHSLTARSTSARHHRIARSGGSSGHLCHSDHGHGYHTHSIDLAIDLAVDLASGPVEAILRSRL